MSARARTDIDKVMKGIERETRKVSESIALAGEHAKGLAFDIVEIEPGHAEPVVKAGERQFGCVAKADVTHERFEVKVRVSGGEQKIRFELIKVGERYYLVDLSRRFNSNPTDDVMAKFKRHVDTICACQDTNCITDATERYVKEMAEWVNAGHVDEVTSEQDKRDLEAYTKTMTDCTTQIVRRLHP